MKHSALNRAIAEVFQKRLMQGVLTTNQTPVAPAPLTLDTLREAKARLDALGPPPEPIRTSKLATALPTAQPHTDDMRQMVERIGRQRVPACLHIRGMGYFVHPRLLRATTEQGAM